MKISLIVMSSSELVSSEKNNILSTMRSALYKNNQEILSSTIIRSQSKILENTLRSNLESSDCVLLLVENGLDKPYMAKRVLCSLFGGEMVTSTYAKANIDDYLRSFNVPMKREDATFSQMPNFARTIKNPLGVFQGCLCEKDDKTVFLLPLEYNELSHMFFASVLPYILSSRIEGAKTYVLKTFGIKYAHMLILLKDMLSSKHNIEVVCNEYLGVGEVIINAPRGVRYDYVDRFVADVFGRLYPYIYSDKDESESECIFSLLSMRHLTISFAEDFTAGNMSCTFLSASHNATDVMRENYVLFSGESKERVLGVDGSIARGKDYKEMAYQMAVGLIDKTGCDIAVSTTGDLEKGEVAIAIGTSEGIHIFTDTVTGGREEKITYATSRAFFELIRKLKKNNFHIGEYVD